MSQSQEELLCWQEDNLGAGVVISIDDLPTPAPRKRAATASSSSASASKKLRTGHAAGIIDVDGEALDDGGSPGGCSS